MDTPECYKKQSRKHPAHLSGENPCPPYFDQKSPNKTTINQTISQTEKKPLQKTAKAYECKVG
ncbi:hypothetical protein GCM10009001_27880 [Virgibacillus siamensis]|uniref:Uncharacterized protein n=1 Tax=Virgibacillus siamensis TaxID=480071 RepID=A0ABN1GD19_9BACI